jgi:hypothetical protein
LDTIPCLVEWLNRRGPDAIEPFFWPHATPLRFVVPLGELSSF